MIISAGFLLDGSQYRSYCQELATWGYVALLYDVSELLDDQQSVAAIRTMMDACEKDVQVKREVNQCNNGERRLLEIQENFLSLSSLHLRRKPDLAGPHNYQSEAAFFRPDSIHQFAGGILLLPSLWSDAGGPQPRGQAERVGGRVRRPREGVGADRPRQQHGHDACWAWLPVSLRASEVSGRDQKAER